MRQTAYIVERGISVIFGNDGMSFKRSFVTNGTHPLVQNRI